MQIVTSPDTAQLASSNKITEHNMGWTGVKVLWRDAAENTSRMSTENPVTAFANSHLLWWCWNVEAFCFGRFFAYFPTVTTDSQMTLHYIACLYLLLLGCISFALVTSDTHVLVLCKSPSLSQHYGCCTQATEGKFRIFTELMATKDINISHLTIYYIKCPSKVKGFCLIIHPSLSPKKPDSWDYRGCVAVPSLTYKWQWGPVLPSSRSKTAILAPDSLERKGFC